MKLPIIIAVIFFIVLGVVANIYVFKLATMPWIGLMIMGLIILGIIGTFVGKANRKRKGIPGEPNAFIFPDKTAKKLKKMDLGIQYEASVISSALLMLGIVLFLVYFVFFTQSNWVMKGLIIFNSVCGMGLMGGMLVTYYQQLVAYRESTQFMRMAAQAQYKPLPTQSNTRQVSLQQYQERKQQRQQQYQQPQPEPEEVYDDGSYQDEQEDYQNYQDYTNERRSQM